LTSPTAELYALVVEQAHAVAAGKLAGDLADARGKQAAAFFAQRLGGAAVDGQRSGGGAVRTRSNGCGS